MHNYKEFKTFNEGVTEIRETVQDINSIIAKYEEFNNINEDCIYTPEMLTAAIIDSVMNDFPCIDDKEYPRTVALSISAKEVGYKSRGAMSFGWKNIIKEDTGELCYSFRISFFSKAPYVLKIEKILAELGWTQKEIEFKHNNRNNGGFVKRNRPIKKNHINLNDTQPSVVIPNEVNEELAEDTSGKRADSDF